MKSNSPLARARAQLRGLGAIPSAAEEFAKGAESLGAALRQIVLAEIPAFSASGNPDILPEFELHGAEHIRELVRLLEGGEAGDFTFVRAHAHHRAEQRFPLEATLHAYRCGHRVLACALADAAAEAVPENRNAAKQAMSGFASEYTATISDIAIAEYVAQTRALAEAESGRRSELLNVLLNGYDESDSHVARLLKRAGYLEQRQAYCVAAAQPANPAEVENPARAERIVSAISDAMAGTSIRVLTGIRDTMVIAVLSDRRRQSGWTAPQANLADRVYPLLLMLGPAVQVGLSGDHPSTSYLPRALHEASIALDFASVSQRVVQFSHLPVRSLLVHHGAGHIQSAPHGWVASLMAANEKSGGALLTTLQAIADADMNIQKAARQLGKHPNTLYHRLERIKDLTGLDGQRYRDLTELLLGVECSSVQRQPPGINSSR
jgi:hypothetical protein